MITTSTGTTIDTNHTDHGTTVILDHPEAPDHMRHTKAGRIIGGGFQAAPIFAFTLSPEVLRAIATLTEQEQKR